MLSFGRVWVGRSCRGFSFGSHDNHSLSFHALRNSNKNNGVFFLPFHRQFRSSFSLGGKEDLHTKQKIEECSHLINTNHEYAKEFWNQLNEESQQKFLNDFLNHQNSQVANFLIVHLHF
jgi:hypothetical protein